MLNDTDRAVSALHAIPNDLSGDDWLRPSIAAKVAGVSFDDWHDWCVGASNYKGESDCRARWKSFDTSGPIQAGTLFKAAAEHGWRINGKTAPKPAPERVSKPVDTPRKPAPGMSAAEVWERGQPATSQHPYAIKKQASQEAMPGLRVLPADDTLHIGGESMAGALVVPCMAGDGTLSTLQLIPPAGKKMNLPGCKVEGWFTVGNIETGQTVYIVEGIGQAWACWVSTGAAAVVAFGWGNVRKVATALRQSDVAARLVLCPDVGKESDADKIAAEVGAAVARMPEGWPANSDLNDLFCSPDGGFDVVAALLESAVMPPVSYPVSVAFADELGDRYEPPDELIEGVITAGDGSVLYGDSNSGKTFLCIDMACAVARGVTWQGKRTEQGLVVYLAAESPASVRGRLQAYQKHHNCKVPNFAIVQSPIDLFDGDADTKRVIDLVHILERQRGQKVRLIVGDTLARLSAGANENAGQDMGLVVRRFDRIRTECKAHFLLIHHSGKAAAAGARGWSGIRAAVDTEIEISDSPAGRCIEITKQRDLSTKGERIGFRLDVVTLGHTKWGMPATSCVVVAADTPVKQTVKRMGEVEGAVIEFLAAHKIGIKKRDVVTHFEGRYEKGPIYRAMKTLVTAGAIHEAAGMVCVSGAAK